MALRLQDSVVEFPIIFAGGPDVRKGEVMRSNFLACLSGYLLSASGLAWASEPSFPQPALVRAPVDKIYLPHGFDDNDNVELILKGQFPNTCYKTGPVSVDIDKKARKIKINAQSYRAQQTMCADVMISFIQPVHLGILDQGSYSVELAGNPNVTPIKLNIELAKHATQDDYLYAPVDTATVAVGDSDDNNVLRIEGNYPYMLVGCMVTKELRTSYDKDGVLTVQPISEFADGDECTSQKLSTHYKIEKDLGKVGLKGEYLIHVRTLNGLSLNYMVDSKPIRD